ncbi:MAG TPA: nucleoside transporter C-terminal domain-containing protein [Verrucomicrobiota bacterium]|nr:Na+ dependent nucleoside transporter domain protein [Verrucomicrobiales bacterium]HRI11496.1 nucleoside transporter C-terminal domain-containing protein [Verrucomicrobiota bacterium]
MERWTSLLGLIVFIGVAWCLSSHRRRFPWQTVFWGLVFQGTVAILILQTRPGRILFDGFQAVITRFTSFADAGNQLVFGALARPDALERGFGPGSSFLLVVTLTGIIIFVSAVSSLLYHYGILQYVVRGMAWVMRRAMRTSGSETLGAAANIFMGQTEAPLVIKPYLERMTRSELFCVMTSGFATIAGSVLAVYTGVLKIPAGDLLTASVMSAPAALMIAKIMQPETQVSDTAAGAKAAAERTAVNGLDAICVGASDGMKLAINVAAMLIAFTALVALLNFLFGGIAHGLGWQTDRPLQEILGYINAPCAWLMGIPAKDCLVVGQILGERVVLNEFIGYISLSEAKARLDPRSYQLAIYALCGFANFASIAIQIGGIGALVPSRRGDLAQLGLRAMVGGLLACYLTACVAGLLI